MLCGLCDSAIDPGDSVVSFGFEVVHAVCADQFHGGDEVTVHGGGE